MGLNLQGNLRSYLLKSMDGSETRKAQASVLLQSMIGNDCKKSQSLLWDFARAILYSSVALQHQLLRWNLKHKADLWYSTLWCSEFILWQTFSILDLGQSSTTELTKFASQKIWGRKSDLFWWLWLCFSHTCIYIDHIVSQAQGHWPTSALQLEYLSEHCNIVQRLVEHRNRVLVQRTLWLHSLYSPTWQRKPAKNIFLP